MPLKTKYSSTHGDGIWLGKPLLITLPLILVACGSQNTSNTNEDAEDETEIIEPSALDIELSEVIDTLNLDQDPIANRDLPSIDDPLAQLGKKLFFSKSLGGDFDSACVTCHHPSLGGADQLSLSVGVSATNPELLGVGRTHTDGQPPVPRNAPTVFNVGLWDTGLFWDSRVESLGKETDTNGALSGIRTPDSVLNIADPTAGANLAAAQARFPVTSSDEMKGFVFENGSTNTDIRDHLAARIGDYGAGENEIISNEWLSVFQEAFGVADTAENLITFDNIALAIGEYERSMTFTNTPWFNYTQGDLDALNDEQKQGALLFFGAPNEGGAGCAACHNGDLFSDGQHHVIAFPQIGVGKGDGLDGSDDFGRERETGDADDRYRFRTPSLLNISESAPYGHAGAYETLEEVVRHYSNPRNTVEDYFEDGGWCQQAQFADLPDCSNLYPNAETNTELALDKLASDRLNGDSILPNINLNATERSALVAFLHTLTDPCVQDRGCLSDWIADPNTDDPDGQMLQAIDLNGNTL